LSESPGLVGVENRDAGDTGLASDDRGTIRDFHDERFDGKFLFFKELFCKILVLRIKEAEERGVR